MPGGRAAYPSTVLMNCVPAQVAGVDRMVLTEQLAVMDMVALADFLLLPEDALRALVMALVACTLASLIGIRIALPSLSIRNSPPSVPAQTVPSAFNTTACRSPKAISRTAVMT